MNLEKLITEVRIVLPDNEYTDDNIKDLINESYQAAVDKVSVFTLIPDLKGVDVISTEPATASVSLEGLPGGFSGILLKVKSSVNSDIRRYGSIEDLMNDYENLLASGDVEAVALEGKRLWYCKVPPDPQVLTVVYYKNVTPLELPYDIPDIIPASYHRKLLVSGSAAIVWNVIEDGTDGDKLNTNTHLAEVSSGITMFLEYLSRRRQNIISSVWRV